MSTENDDASRLDDAAALPLSEDSGLCGGPGQISCAEANELIQSLLDRLTDPATGEKVREHLGDCPPCETEFVVYQRIIASLERCRPEPPPATRERLERFCSGLSSGELPAEPS
jgi:hypothetical protein